MKNISPSKFNDIFKGSNRDFVIIDVRSPAEYKGSRIKGARNIPMDDIKEATEQLKNVTDVYVMCASGIRSQQACLVLEKEGIQVTILDGGLNAWIDNGFETESDGDGPIPA